VDGPTLNEQRNESLMLGGRTLRDTDNDASKSSSLKHYANIRGEIPKKKLPKMWHKYFSEQRAQTKCK
jgi:hypothetical protein